MEQSSVNFAAVMQPDDWVLEQGHNNLQVTLKLLGQMRRCTLACCRPVPDW